MNTYAICLYCKEDLRVKMIAQFIERVDSSVLNVYSEGLNRMQKRAVGQGRMMRMAAGMAKGMQGTMVGMMQGMIDFPPMVTILKCMNYDAALSVEVPSSGD